MAMGQAEGFGLFFQKKKTQTLNAPDRYRKEDEGATTTAKRSRYNTRTQNDCNIIEKKREKHGHINNISHFFVYVC